MKQPNQFIQSWRGIAVLLVVFYHLTNRVPPEYLDMASGPTVTFYSGKIGVLIFFVISGYLITKSLLVSRNLANFYAKRISRIWPLFILASISIYLFSLMFEMPVVPDGPKQFYAHPRNWVDLIGSLFFLEDFGFRWMDGVFWSVLVELKFYFWIGLLAAFRPQTFIRNLALTAIVLSLLEMASSQFISAEIQKLGTFLNGVFIARYLPFFAIGALLTQSRDKHLLSLLLIITAMELATKTTVINDFDLGNTVVFMTLLCLFLAADRWLFKARIIQHIGDYSYSFYLFHQMIGLSIIKSLGGLLSYDAALIVALITTYAIAIFASWLAEWRFRSVFHDALLQVFQRLHLDRFQLNPAVGQPR